MLQLIVFLLGSFGFLILSFRSISHPVSHGFPRFFAFEAILGLVVLNAPVWFVHPFSPAQILSWALLLGAVLLAIHAIWALRKYGKPDQSVQDSRRLSFEKTTRLVTEGPYKYIRHPMYASLLLFAWGVFLKQISLSSALLLVLISLALYITAFFEERENLSLFGDVYNQYMRLTKRFIPFVF